MTPQTKRQRRFAYLTEQTMLRECIESERLLSVASDNTLPEDDGDWNNSDGDEQDDDGDC